MLRVFNFLRDVLTFQLFPVKVVIAIECRNIEQCPASTFFCKLERMMT